MNLMHDGVLSPDEPDFRDERRETEEYFAKFPHPRNCGECARWWKPESAAYGYCDNWAGVKLEAGSVCNPNLGIKKENVK